MINDRLNIEKDKNPIFDIPDILKKKIINFDLRDKYEFHQIIKFHKIFQQEKEKVI